MQQLARLTGLRHLDLVRPDNGGTVEPFCARSLACVLAALSLLTHLNLFGFLREDCFATIAPAIGCLSGLQELGLEASSALVPAKPPLVAGCMQDFSGLTALRVLSVTMSLTYAHYKLDSRVALAAWLAKLPGLEVLNMVQMQMCEMQRGVCAADICAALAHSATVTHLDLSCWVSLSEDEAGEGGLQPRSVAQSLCDLGPDMCAFGSALSGLSRLRVLRLGANCLDTIGLAATGDA